MATLAIVIAVAGTVATVGAVVGAIGLGLSIVGMITKNKTLLKIGKIAGIAGGAMSLAGFAVGGIASAFAESGALAVTGEVGAASTTAGALSTETITQTAEHVATGAEGVMMVRPEQAAQNIGGPLVGGASSASNSTLTQSPALQTYAGHVVPAEGVAPVAVQAGQNFGGNVIGTPGIPVQPPSVSPYTATTGGISPIDQARNAATIGPNGIPRQTFDVPLGPPKPPTPLPVEKPWLTPGNAALIGGGLSAVGGLAGGLFEGSVASDDLEFQKERQRRGDFAPLIEYEEQERNTAPVGSIGQFPAAAARQGLINARGGRR